MVTLLKYKYLEMLALITIRIKVHLKNVTYRNLNLHPKRTYLLDSTSVYSILFSKRLAIAPKAVKVGSLDFKVLFS